MATRLSTRLVCLVLGVTGAALGGCDEGGDAAGETAGDAAESGVTEVSLALCEAWGSSFEAWDQWYAGCCSEEEQASKTFERLAHFGTDGLMPAMCPEVVQDNLDRWGLTPDPTHLPECLDAIRAQTPPPPEECDSAALAGQSSQARAMDSILDLPECRPLFAGTLEAGEECLGDAQCVEGLDCLSDGCGVRLGEGEVCINNADCEAGLHCAGAAQVQGVCSGPKPSGATCDLGDVCAAGLTCNGLICEPLAQVGEACLPGFERCGAGAWCDLTQGPHGTCLSNVAAGGPCESDKACATGTCDIDAGVCLAMCGGA